MKKLSRTGNIILIIIGLVMLISYDQMLAEENFDERYFDVFKGYYDVKTEADLEKYEENNHFVKIEADSIEKTNYQYGISLSEQALYVYLNLDDKKIVALLSKSKAEKLFSC